MTSVSTAQFATQSAGLITTLKDGTLADADFVNQWAQLLASWGVSNPALALGVQTLLTSTTSFQAQFFNWLGGAATGGAANINGTGSGGPYYPFTNAGGVEFWVICPAGIAANPVGPSTLLTASAVDGLAAATLTETNPAWPVSVDGASGRVLKKVNFFPARQTADLQDITAFLASDYIAVLRGLGGGSEQRIAAKYMASYFNRGSVSPLDYGAKWDCRETYLCATSAGSSTVDCSEGLYRPQDVGKMYLISSGGAGGVNNYSSMTGYILEYIDAYHVVLDQVCGSSKPDNQMLWGTDDTVANQAAIEACRAPGLYSMGGYCQLPAGMSLTKGLSYSGRMAIVGFDKASQFRRIPQSVAEGAAMGSKNASGQYWPPPTMGNESNQVDFPIHDAYGIDGSHYMNLPGKGSSKGFVFNSVDSSQVLTQLDAFVQFRNLDIRNFLDNGMETFGRGDGTVMNVRIESCQGYGWQCGSYDMNILGLYAEACGNAGLYFSTTSGNNNAQNVKLSYNGSNRSGFSTLAGGANFYVEGSGNLVSSFRFQESYGANAVIAGFNNSLVGGALEDTSDQWWSGIYSGSQPQGGGEPDYAVRPAIAFVTRAGYSGASPPSNNRLFDIMIDASIHPNNNWATHGIWLGAGPNGGPVNNYVRAYTTLRNWDTTDNIVGTGLYTAGVVGSDVSGGFASNNLISVNDVKVTGPITNI